MSATARSFTAIPAIDIREGRVVRLRQGDYAQETRYANDPLELAGRYAQAGAEWLHLVDLDAARAGGYTLHRMLSALRDQTTLSVQTGGGVRCRDDVARILDAGAQRVVVGSLAVTETAQVIDWLHEFGSDRITVALDSRQDANGEWRLPVRGWTETTEPTLFELAARYVDAGLRHLLCTDIARDGMLSGPNVDLYRELWSRFPDVRIQASGGFRSADDIRDVVNAGCDGAVLGKALLDGRLRIQDALQAASGDVVTAC